MNRYMAKLNAEHLPGNDPGKWEAEWIRVPKPTPRRVQETTRSGVPQIGVGDEVWVCTDRTGPGIAVSASVKDVEETDGGLRIQLNRIRVIDQPIPLSVFPRLQSGSAMFSQLQRNRHPDLYFFDDNTFSEFQRVVLDRVGPKSLPYRPLWMDIILRNRTEARAKIEENLKIPLSLRPVRPGQQAFRDALMRLYDGKCVVTECSVRCTLEAAHIVPWTGDPELDQPENGFLLRRDIHALFDSGLFIVDPSSGRIRIDASLSTTDYAGLADVVIDHSASPELLSERAAIFESLKGTFL